MVFAKTIGSLLFIGCISSAVGFAAAAESASTFLEKGTRLENSDKAAEALKVYEDGYKKFPNDAELPTRIAGMYGLMGDFATEIQYANQALKNDSKYVRAYINRGTAYAQLQKYSEARADFLVAAKLNPESGLGEYSLGALEEAQGRNQEALKHYEKCQTESRDNEDCLFNAAMMHANLENLPQAKAMLEKLLAKNPKAKDAKEILAKIEGDLKKSSATKKVKK